MASAIVAVSVPVRPPLTVKALPAGADDPSRFLSKVTFSVVPYTVALWNTGGAGALLVTVLFEKFATRENCLPVESCSGLLFGAV